MKMSTRSRFLGYRCLLFVFVLWFLLWTSDKDVNRSMQISHIWINAISVFPLFSSCVICFLPTSEVDVHRRRFSCINTGCKSLLFVFVLCSIFVITFSVLFFISIFSIPLKWKHNPSSQNMDVFVSSVVQRND